MSGTPDILSAKKVGHSGLLIIAVLFYATRAYEPYRSLSPSSNSVASYGSIYRQKIIENAVMTAIYMKTTEVFGGRLDMSVEEGPVTSDWQPFKLGRAKQ
jgi:hypothetical protein